MCLQTETNLFTDVQTKIRIFSINNNQRQQRTFAKLPYDRNSRLQNKRKSMKNNIWIQEKNFIALLENQYKISDKTIGLRIDHTRIICIEVRIYPKEESSFHSGHFLKVFFCNPVQNSECVCAIVFHICKMWRFVETISFCVFHLKSPSHRSHSFAPMLVYVYLLLSIYLFSFLYLDASKPFSFWLTVLCFDVFLYALGSQWIICDRTHFLS